MNLKITGADRQCPLWVISGHKVDGPRTSNAVHFAGHCADKLNAVELAIDEGIFTGRGNDQTNLLAKLTAADAKVGLGKINSAIDKLMDISDKATALAGSPKQKLVDASDINTAVDNAIACVGNLKAN